MKTSAILEKLSRKGCDVGRIAQELCGKPAEIPAVVNGMLTEKTAVKFRYEKALRAVSEADPAILYPFFDNFVRLLGHENNFIQWGAILIVSNLAEADSKGKFEKVFARYDAPMKGPNMVAAANIINGSVKIAKSKPHLADRIAREILKVETSEYEMHGKPSPECSAVACGHALDAFDAIYALLEKKTAVNSFILRQCGSSRPPVRKKAEKLSKKLGLTRR
jgi:hypothetical protein